MKSKFFGAVANLALLGTVSQAGATSVQPPPVLPVAVVEQTNRPNGTAVQQQGSTANTFTTTGNGISMTSTATFQPSPSVTATATSNVGNGGASASAYIYVGYEFEIFGQSGVQVPVTISANGAVSQNTGPIQQAYATLTLDQYYGSANPFPSTLLGSVCQAGSANSCNNANLNANPSFSIATRETLTSDTVYRIQMIASAEALFSSASASIDPMITSNDSNFSILLSPGVGNSPSATPLPSTWLMLLGGLVGLGFIAHRGSKNGSAALAAA
jgi:hypothetical protein